MGSGETRTVFHNRERILKTALCFETYRVWHVPVSTLTSIIMRISRDDTTQNRWGNMPAIDIINLSHNEIVATDFALAFVGNWSSQS